jgi:hypothetical protein
MDPSDHPHRQNPRAPFPSDRKLLTTEGSIRLVRSVEKFPAASERHQKDPRTHARGPDLWDGFMKEEGPGPVLLPTNLFLNGQNPGKTRMRAPWGS